MLNHRPVKSDSSNLGGCMNLWERTGDISPLVLTLLRVEGLGISIWLFFVKSLSPSGLLWLSDNFVIKILEVLRSFFSIFKMFFSLSKIISGVLAEELEELEEDDILVVVSYDYYIYIYIYIYIYVNIYIYM
jgi:hypothetical protein